MDRTVLDQALRELSEEVVLPVVSREEKLEYYEERYPNQTVVFMTMDEVKAQLIEDGIIKD